MIERFTAIRPTYVTDINNQIINICENSSVTIQSVTPTEISKLVATLKKTKAEDIDNLTADQHLQYGGSTISDYTLHQPSITYFTPSMYQTQ